MANGLISAATGLWKKGIDKSYYGSKYEKEYQQAYSDYQKKRQDYLDQRSQSNNSAYQGIFRPSKTLTKREQEKAQQALEKEITNAIGAAPSEYDYYQKYTAWKKQGKPEYSPAEEMPDSTTQDSASSSSPSSGTSDSVGSSSSSGASASVAKGYELSGSRQRGRGYTPSSPEAAGDGVGRRQTDEAGNDLGASAEGGGMPARKRYKPLGK